MTEPEWETWDIDLIYQPKKVVSRLNAAIAEFGAIVVERHEEIIFTDARLRWRNPMLMKIRLAMGQRWAFILKSRVWLHRPTRLLIDYGNLFAGTTRPINRIDPRDHFKSREIDAILKGVEIPRPVIRRNYRIHPRPCILDYHPCNGSRANSYPNYTIIDLDKDVKAVLDGDLDRIVNKTL